MHRIDYFTPDNIETFKLQQPL